MLRVAIFALLAGALLVSAKPTQKLQARYGGSSDNSDSSNDKDGDSSNNAYGSGRRNLNALAGSGLRDKVINLGTKYLGTGYSNSGSTKVQRSRKDNWFRKNFSNTVTSNLKTLRRQVHTDTKILVKKPLTVDNLHVNQHTDYVKNIYPHLQKVWVQRYGQVIKPSHLTQVSRSSSASRRTYRHPLSVSHKSRSVNLGTDRQRTRDLGVNNLGYQNNDYNRGGDSSNNNNSGNYGGKGRRGDSSNDNSDNSCAYC